MDAPAETTEAMNVALFANELKGGLCDKDRRFFRFSCFFEGVGFGAIR